MRRLSAQLLSNPLVSVVVSNYNHGQYLGEAIESLARQTHRCIELHLIDDGSTDASRPLISRLAARFRSRFARISTHFEEENVGQLACLNRHLDRVRGELAVVFDADDVLFPNFLEESIDALRSFRGQDPSVAFVYPDCELIDREGRALGVGRALPWNGELLERSSYVPGCALTLTTALRGAAPFDESIRVATKHHRWRLIRQDGWQGRHLRRPLFSYRLHAGNNSGIGARLLPELNGDRASERVLAEVWPTAPARVG